MYNENGISNVLFVDKIKEVGVALDNGLYNAALALCLTIPDICAWVRKEVEAKSNGKVSTHYEPGKQSYKMEIVSADLPSGQLGIPDYVKTPLEGDGDFRSDECIEILKEADVVVTNPPFSRFREYVSQLMEYEKKFIIIGNINAITYKEFFPLLRNNKVWVGTGFNLSMIFRSPYKNELESNRKFVQAKGYDPDYYIKTPAVCWYTNVDIQKRHTPIDLYMHYYGNEDHYPKYDNYDAINVDKTCEIPEDYDGVMGVPISFMDKYCPEQFEIIGNMASTQISDFNFGYPYITGKKKYARVLIRRRNNGN